MSSAVTISSPAKLTRWLRITGVRDDGYHLLETEMVSIDLADILEITPSKRTELSVVDEVVGGCGLRGVPTGEENLVVRTLRVLGRTARVRLVKRIPPGAGLGGGSSNAAAILRWAGVTDPAVAAHIGADVPFCVRGGRARVSGIGELVEPLAHEDRRFVLLAPPFAVSTAAVYRAWDGRNVSGEPLSAHEPGEPGNDLEAAAIELEPRLAKWQQAFADATGQRPSLAGSGSVWFVEGVPADLGLAGHDHLALGPERGAFVPVQTVPAVF